MNARYWCYLRNSYASVFLLIIYYHVSHFLKSKLNSSQHGFIKSKSTVTYLFTFLHFVTPLVCSQCQTDSMYFDFSNDFDILPHSLVLHKLSNYGLSRGYLNWFLGYLTNGQSCVGFSSICTFVAICRAVRRTSRISFRALALQYFY
jgi:hypothetical protein